MAQRQWKAKEIHSDFVTKDRQQKFGVYLQHNTLFEVFQDDIDAETQYDFEGSCLSLTQFLVKNDTIRNGLLKMISHYNTLSYSPKRALLAAIYAVYPTEFQSEISFLIKEETNPKLFAIEAAYLDRIHPGDRRTKALIQNLLQEKIFPKGIDPTSLELIKYIQQQQSEKQLPLPHLNSLFAWNKAQHIKAIYSFQNWDRDYPGIAIIQLEDGSFAKDANGNIILVRQLARSATDLPYFLTNGNTPQGIFSIHGTSVSFNQLIGPTPNLQTLLPFEKESVYWFRNYDSTLSPLQNYIQQLPPDWQHYAPMQEAFAAGNCGRSEIIAHGATIPPHYFKEFPFYPLVPTDGCMAAQESWNAETGYLDSSNQLNLVNAFCQTPEMRGRLFVINISNLPQAISKQQVLNIIRNWQ